MDVRSTGIIGRASAVRINYRKWVGPSIDTIDPEEVGHAYGKLQQ